MHERFNEIIVKGDDKAFDREINKIKGDTAKMRHLLVPVDTNQRSALCVACGSGSEKYVKSLLELVKDSRELKKLMFSLTDLSLSPLGLAAEYGYGDGDEEIQERHKRICKMLLDACNNDKELVDCLSLGFNWRGNPNLDMRSLDEVPYRMGIQSALRLALELSAKAAAASNPASTPAVAVSSSVISSALATKAEQVKDMSR